MLFIVGNSGGTNVAESFARSAKHLGIPFTFQDVRAAQSSYRIINSIWWRLLDHRSIFMHEFGKNLLAVAKREKPLYFLTTGLTPVSSDVLHAMRSLGIVCLHYSTDDPWNPGQSADWFLRTLPIYDIVFTPRTSNIKDLSLLGCHQVIYLPFGYDEFIFSDVSQQPSHSDQTNVLFVGGADQDRVDFIESLLSKSIPMTLVGGYWERYPSLKAHALGHKAPGELCRLTQSATVNLCLVRRANRDGHVMRSFEIAALGGCMVVEDTIEHRNFFGPEGECVLYFNGPGQAVAKIRMLLNNTNERKRLANAVFKRITSGGHTYTHRLKDILEAARMLPLIMGHSKS